MNNGNKPVLAKMSKIYEEKKHPPPTAPGSKYTCTVRTLFLPSKLPHLIEAGGNMRQRGGGIRPVARHRGHAHAPLTVGVLIGGDELDAAPPALRYRCPVLVGHLGQEQTFKANRG